MFGGLGFRSGLGGLGFRVDNYYSQQQKGEHWEEQ